MEYLEKDSNKYMRDIDLDSPSTIPLLTEIMNELKGLFLEYYTTRNSIHPYIKINCINCCAIIDTGASNTSIDYDFVIKNKIKYDKTMKCTRPRNRWNRSRK